MADPVVVGSTRTVNSYQAGDQGYSTVIGLSGGGYVIAWQSVAQAGPGAQLYFQRYDDAGRAVGGETKLPSGGVGTDSVYSGQVTLAALQDGGFVAGWSNQYPTSGSSYVFDGIATQRYDRNGSSIGSATVVALPGRNEDSTPYASQGPDISGLTNGGYAISWSAITPRSGSGQDTRFDVYTERVDAQGHTLGAFQTNTTFVTRDQVAPSVAPLASGGYVVTWQSQDQSGGIILRQSRFDGAGRPQAPEEQVVGQNLTTPFYGYEGQPATAALSGGGYVVVWTHTISGGTVLVSQRYDAAGRPAGDAATLPATFHAQNSNPSVAAMSDGGYVVAWGDTSGGVTAQRFDSGGATKGDRVYFGDQNVSRTFSGADVHVAALSGNRYVVTWTRDAGHIFGSAAQGLEVLSSTVVPNLLPPTIAGGSDVATRVRENSKSAGKVVATDPEGSTGLLYSIAGGADADRFTIDQTGNLSFVTPPDFEAPADADHDNTYQVSVTVSDYVLSSTQNRTITVANVDEAPVFPASSGLEFVPENQTAVGAVLATDPEGASVTYSLAGADAALFTIDPTSGLLAFKTAPDYEKPTAAGKGNVYKVVVLASDGTNVGQHTVDVGVTNVVEDQTVTLAPDVHTFTPPSDDNWTVFAGNGADTLRGASGHDELHGGGGRDVLYGGAGGDALFGGAGDDTYYVTDASDTVSETENGRDAGGVDLVRSTVSFTLPDFVEKLKLDGSAAIDGTGNDGANSIRGSGLSTNTLKGLGGDDRLYGQAGDSLYGGADSDYLEAPGTAAVADGGTGYDTLRLLSSPQTSMRIVDIEHILAAGTGRFDFSGATVLSGSTPTGVSVSVDPTTTGPVTLIGTGLSDQLVGGAGTATLDGGKGDDRLYGHAQDAMYGREGVDRFYLSGVTPESGFGVIDGGPGSDILSFSGQGALTPTYLRNVENVIVGDGGDLDLSAFSKAFASLRIADAATGGARLVGTQGNDVIAAGSGSDTVAGGAGNDLIYAGSGPDTFAYGAADGFDTVNGFKVGDDHLSFETDLPVSMRVSGSNILFESGDTHVRLTGVSAAGHAMADFLA